MNEYNGYKCFYRGKTCEGYADTSYAAQQLAALIFKVKPSKAYEITVCLCELAGEQVTTTADF
jgi:hypothetical protein